MIDVNILLPRSNFNVSIQETFSDGITGIFGPSGSGKTSLLHAISGLAKPEKGRIAIGDKVLFDSEKKINLPVEKRNIGYVFQEGRLFPHMTVEKNLMYGIKKNSNSTIGFNEVVELLNLGHILQSKPSQISGGERQRTALGRSLLSSPDILLLDEPFSAVDFNLREQILPFIIHIQKTFHIPVLVVSHDLPDLLKLSSTLCIIKKGECKGHDVYFNLLKNSDVKDVFESNALVSTFEMKVSEFVPETNMATLHWEHDENEILVTCEKSKKAYEVGQTVRVILYADDIALSTDKIENVSIQNQIRGTVKEIILKEATLVCIVDVGFNLIVEVTLAAQRKIRISPGAEVWCLFKSVAIDVVGE